MRLVKLSDLNEHERKEYERQRLAREQKMIEENKAEIARVENLKDNIKPKYTLPTKRENILSTARDRQPYSARTRFITDNAEQIKTAREVSSEENSFNKFKKDILSNPNKVATILTDVGSSIQAGRINSKTASNEEKNMSDKLNLYQGIANNAIGVTGLVSNIAGESEKLLGKMFNNEKLYELGNNTQNTMKAISEINNFSNKVTNKIDNNVYKTARKVGNTLANMSPSIALSVLTGGTSTAGKLGMFLAKNSGALLQATGVAGNELTETLNDDNSNFGQALATGVLKGGVEYGTEKLFGGNILAKGTSLDNVVSKGIANNVKSKVGQFLLSKGYEFAGEQTEELISDNLGYVIDKLINNKEMPGFKEWLNNTEETAKTTFLTTLALQCLGLGGGTYNDVKDLNNNSKLDTEAQKWITEAQKIIGNASNTQIKQNRFIDTAKSNNIDIDSEDIITINRVLKERGIEGEFNANLFSNNSQSALWKTNKDANGNITRQVIFNPNADTQKRIQGLAIHEMWHDFEGMNQAEQIKDLVLSFDKTRAEYNVARESLAKTYSKIYDSNSVEFNSLIENEAVADILGNKLGNQEFVNNLTKQDRTLGQKIYDWVVDKLNKINKLTGYSNEKIFWSDVKNKFENAFKQDYSDKNNNQILYSKKLNGYNPDININSDIGKYKIKNINNKYEVIKQVSNLLQNKYLSNEKQSKPITNIDTGMEIEIWKRGINETFGNDKYYQNLPDNLKKAKIASMEHLAKLIKYGEVRAKESGNYHDTNSKVRYAYLVSPITIDGNNYNITMDIRKSPNGENRFYIHDLKINEGNSSKSQSGLLMDELSSTNSIPPQNSDVNTNNKYSMQENGNNTSNWQSYLDENYKSTGTGKSIQELKLPVAKSIREDVKLPMVRDDFSTQVDNFVSGKMRTSETLYLGETPSVIQNLGISNNPITMRYGKLKSIITEDNDPTSKYHGLSIENIKKLPEALANPLNILKSSSQDNSIVVITDLADKNERPIIASIKIDAKGQVGEITFLSNRLTSVYGKNNYDQFMQREIAKGNLLYDIDKGIIKELPTSTMLQLHEGLSSSVDTNNNVSTTNTNIPQNNNFVKGTTNSNIQNAKEYVPQEINVADKEQVSEETSVEKAAEILTENPERVKPEDRKWAIIKANILDKGIVFEELSRKADKLDRKAGIKANNRDLQGKWDYTLTATARGQNAIGNTRYEYDNKTKTQKQVSKSLEDIRSEVGEYKQEFYNYMYHQLNIDRMTLEDRFNGDTGINYERTKPIKNKPVFSNDVTADISRKVVTQIEQKYPQFKSWAKDVYDFNNANKQELVRSGVISQELADKLGEMYPHYIPIKRIDKKGNAINVPLDTNRTGVNSPLKRAVGGTSDIMPLFETMADRTMQTYKASARNSFGVELKKTLQKLNQYQQTTNEIANIDTIMDEMGTQESTEKLLQEGENGNNPTFTVFENGNKVTYDITRDMYDALKPLNDSSILTKTSKILNTTSNLRRAVLTEYNPLFLITNAVKDAQDVVLNSQHSLRTYMKFPEAYSQIITQGYWYNEYVSHGGEQNSYFKDGEFSSDKKVKIPVKLAKIPLDKIGEINGVIEMAPRLAEYIASREKGRSIETSMLDASRVTTNFKAGGDITKFVNRNGATFLNASVQGAMQAARNIQEANVKGLKGWSVLATKMTVAGLPAIILNNLLWKDDDDYEELQDYAKDNYYIVAKIGNSKFLRIPKGRAAATIQKMISNANEYITKGKELNIDNFSKDFWEDILFAADNLAPNNPIENNVISPIKQVVDNKSWYGEDIVPSRLQNKPKAEQYDETIDSLSIWLGKILNQSPYKINYLLDQYGGGISDVVLPMLTKQAENNVIEDKFTIDSVMKSRHPGEFYEEIDNLKVKANSDNATDEDILKYKYASKVSNEMSELYKQKREIQNSSKTDEEKKAKLKEVQKNINDIAKSGKEGTEDIVIKGNTAIVGGQSYYKKTNLQTKEKEWTKLSDEEIKNNKAISLDTFADYNEKIAKLTIEQRKSGEIKEKGSIKDRDKIKILLNSNYTKKEKQALYEGYILSSNDKKYPVIKKIGLDIEKYLDFKAQDFEADKDSNGNVIMSKKAKVYEYLNKNNTIPFAKRAILLKMEGYNDYNTKIIEYVKNENFTNTERREILEAIGFKIDKNGGISWTTMLPITKYK